MAVPPQNDHDLRRVRVAQDVRDGFLGNAKAGRFKDKVEPAREFIRAEMALQLPMAHLLMRVPAQGGRKSDIIQDGGVQIQGEVMDLL